MNRVFLQTGGDTSAEALHKALREGHSVASNGPLLALQVDGRNPGDTIELAAGTQARVTARRCARSRRSITSRCCTTVASSHAMGRRDATSADLKRHDSRDRERLDPAARVERRA